tara:strand:- start:44 stop:1798 length:1755 start_codon:yes stop_codon:yes gene_type:complete
MFKNLNYEEDIYRCNVMVPIKKQTGASNSVFQLGKSGTAPESPSTKNTREKFAKKLSIAKSPVTIAIDLSNDSSTSEKPPPNKLKIILPSRLELDKVPSLEFADKSDLTPEDLQVAIRDKTVNKKFFSSIPLDDGSSLILLNHIKIDNIKISEFGKGAEGKVRPAYLIHPNGQKEYVAVKKEIADKWFHKNPSSSGSGKAFNDYIQNKHQIANSIHSPHVLPTYASILAESKNLTLTAFSVSPIIKGSLKEDEISKRYILPDVTKAIRELLIGLKDIHAQNVVHRDLSLDNLFVGFDGRMIIGDLGSAKQLEHDNEKVFYRGKEKIQQQFMNCELEKQLPKEIEKRNYSKQSEIFTVGFSLYESIFHFQKGMGEMGKAFSNLIMFHNELKNINNKPPKNYESYQKDYPDTWLDEDQFNLTVARLNDLIKKNTQETIDNLLSFMDNFFLSHDERPSAELLLEKFNKLFPVTGSETLPHKEITFEPASKTSSVEPQKMLSNSLLIVKFSSKNARELNQLYESNDETINEFREYVDLMWNSGNIETLQELNSTQLNSQLLAILTAQAPELAATDDEYSEPEDSPFKG